MLKKIDIYIIKKLFGTFFFTMFFLMLIVVLIDLNQRQGRLDSNGGTSLQYLKGYAIYFLIYLANTFVQIVVFISVIFFTSRITNNTEIVAMQSGGVNFHRIARPYFISGLIIGLVALGINHYLLPYANVKKNEFWQKYLISNRRKEEGAQDKRIAAFISPNEQLNIMEYNKKRQKGYGFSYFKFDDSLSRKYSLIANQVIWDVDSGAYLLKNAYEKFGNIHQTNKNKLNVQTENSSIKNIPPKPIKNQPKKTRNKTLIVTKKINSKPLKNNALISNFDDSISFHREFKIKLNANPEFLLPGQGTIENMSTPKLLAFIERKKIEGSKNIDSYYTTLYQRTGLPFSTFILTILGLSISSKKRRGGIGINLAVGILMAFSYVFMNIVMGILSSNGTITPLMGTIYPNLLFGLITVFLYFRRALF